MDESEAQRALLPLSFPPYDSGEVEVELQKLDIFNEIKDLVSGRRRLGEDVHF